MTQYRSLETNKQKQIHTNKYIEQLSNKPPTTSIRERQSKENKNFLLQERSFD